MLDFLLNYSPVFVGGELLLGLSLGMFGVALANTVRERYAVWVPLKNRTANRLECRLIFRVSALGQPSRRAICACGRHSELRNLLLIDRRR